MDPIEGVLRKESSPAIYIHIRQDNPETYIATLEKNGKHSVQTWPAIGPAPATPVSILRTYESENPGYAFIPLPSSART
jgi:hypothetical protein